MVGDDDEVGTLCLDCGDVLLCFPCHRAGGVIGMGKDDAGIVVGNIPARAVGVFKADDGNLIVLAADGEGLEHIRCKDIFALGVDTVAAVIVEVGAQARHGVALCAVRQISADVVHEIPRVVKFMVADGGCVIADLLQAERHRVGQIGFALLLQRELVAGDGGTLIGIAVVDQDDILLLGAYALDRSGYIEHAVCHFGIVQNIGVPAASVHIRGG